MRDLKLKKKRKSLEWLGGMHFRRILFIATEMKDTHDHILVNLVHS
jgi:hypothetical protein